MHACRCSAPLSLPLCGYLPWRRPTKRRVPLREMAPPRSRRRDQPRASGERRSAATMRRDVPAGFLSFFFLRAPSLSIIWNTHVHVHVHVHVVSRYILRCVFMYSQLPRRKNTWDATHKWVNKSPIVYHLVAYSSGSGWNIIIIMSRPRSPTWRRPKC